MSKRDEYIAFIDEFKTVSPTISDDQRKGLLRREPYNSMIFLLMMLLKF